MERKEGVHASVPGQSEAEVPFLDRMSGSLASNVEVASKVLPDDDGLDDAVVKLKRFTDSEHRVWLVGQVAEEDFIKEQSKNPSHHEGHGGLGSREQDDAHFPDATTESTVSNGLFPTESTSTSTPAARRYGNRRVAYLRHEEGLVIKFGLANNKAGGEPKRSTPTRRPTAASSSSTRQLMLSTRAKQNKGENSNKPRKESKLRSRQGKVEEEEVPNVKDWAGKTGDGSKFGFKWIIRIPAKLAAPPRCSRPTSAALTAAAFGLSYSDFSLGG